MRLTAACSVGAEARAKSVGGVCVLVGHALHHDLRAMKLDYWPIIDTAFLYFYAGLPSATPGLADLSAAVMGKELRQNEASHHSQVEDALASLQLAQHQLAYGPVTPLPPPPLKVKLAL